MNLSAQPRPTTFEVVLLGMSAHSVADILC